MYQQRNFKKLSTACNDFDLSAIKHPFVDILSFRQKKLAKRLVNADFFLIFAVRLLARYLQNFSRILQNKLSCLAVFKKKHANFCYICYRNTFNFKIH